MEGEEMYILTPEDEEQVFIASKEYGGCNDVAGRLFTARAVKRSTSRGRQV